MSGRAPYSAKRFLLALTLCACAVILLQNHEVARELSFPLQLVAMLCGLLFCFLLFLPAIVLRKRWHIDVPEAAQAAPKAVRVLLAAVYGGYFLLVAAHYLLPYTDMFCRKYYPDADPCLIALLLLLCCVYAARKGVNVITRFGIFLLVLAMVTNLLLFGGSLSSLDFRNGRFDLSGGGSFGQAALYFGTPCFIAVLFACLSGGARRFRVRQVLTALGLTGVKFALVLFCVTFAVGEYAARQDYRTFVLSRVAHFGEFAGIESFYMALSTMSVFMILSLLLCGVNRVCGKEESLWLTAAMAGVILSAQWLARSQNSVKEILTAPLPLLLGSVLTAAVIPVILGCRERRRRGETISPVAVGGADADGLSERAADRDRLGD